MMDKIADRIVDRIANCNDPDIFDPTLRLQKEPDSVTSKLPTKSGTSTFE